MSICLESEAFIEPTFYLMRPLSLSRLFNLFLLDLAVWYKIQGMVHDWLKPRRTRGHKASSFFLRESCHGVWVGALAGPQEHWLALTHGYPTLSLHMNIFLHGWKSIWYAAYDTLMKSWGCMVWILTFMWIIKALKQTVLWFLAINIIVFSPRRTGTVPSVSF